MNIDKVKFSNLEPNKNDPLFGWIDVKTGKNYRLIDNEEYCISAPLVCEDIVEVRPYPAEQVKIIKNGGKILIAITDRKTGKTCFATLEKRQGKWKVIYI